jgi:prepilin-type N-terminal cleavage/methylation domain-containing protein
MKTNRFRPARRRGLTLIELVVTLAILVMVAGLVSAMTPNLLRRASHASGGAAAANLDRAVHLQYLLQRTYPDGFDSLLEAPYTLYRQLPAGSLRQLRPKDLDNADRGMLAAVGIRSTWQHDPVPAGAVTWQAVTQTKTFDATAGGFAADDVAMLNLARIDPNTLFGAGTVKGTPQEIFAVFGVGQSCTLVNPVAGLAEAPVAFGGTAATRPEQVYQRLGVVFRLDRDDATPVRFLGAVVFDEDGIKPAAEKAEGWYR